MKLRNDIDFYINQIQKLDFKSIDIPTWRKINLYEMINHDYDDNGSMNMHDYKIAELPLSNNDIKGMKQFIKEYVRKFNDLEKAVKEYYKGSISIDIQYGNGSVILIKNTVLFSQLFD